MPEKNESPAPVPSLSGAEKSGMRSLLRTLEPKVFVGKNGLTPAVLREIETAFKNEDLIKVKFSGDRNKIAGQIETVSEIARAAVVGSVGKTAGFYRRAERAGD